MKLDKLTPKQQEILDKLCKDSLEEILHTVKTVKYEDIKDDVDWLYKLSGVNQKPIILIFDSWLESQVAANYCAIINLMVSGELNQVQSQVLNQVENQVGNQVENQVENQVRNQVGNQVENQVENQVRNQVENQVRNQVRNQVENQVRNQVENQVENQVRNQVRNQVL